MKCAYKCFLDTTNIHVLVAHQSNTNCYNNYINNNYNNNNDNNNYYYYYYYYYNDKTNLYWYTTLHWYQKEIMRVRVNATNNQ